jgi:crotonobetainyl-CoA:carnitine CoA-transferase CaiB-like acyl-CoA transferase
MKAHPQTAALGMVQPVPEIDLELMALPLSLDGQRPRIRSRAPKLGEHNAAFPGLRTVSPPSS